jgi:very-short-patch-repair endonuclease/predicted transcriptional regulator of viral defense system
MDRVLGAIAGEQHGMVTRRQLVEAGLEEHQIAYRVKAGRLIRRHRGVYAVGHVPLSPHARAMAAVLACGPRATLSHRSAGALWGLLRYAGPPDVTTAGKHRHPHITLHRSRLAETDITTHYGIPTTTPARTIIDLADMLDAASLTRAVHDARLRHILSLDDLAAQLTRGRATRVLASLIDRPTAPTRSVLEDAFLRFLDRHRLPRPEVNAVVAGYEVDMLWRPQRLIAELDGHEFHAGSFERDRDRDADLVAAGFRVVRVTSIRLTSAPQREATRFRTLLGA